MSEQGILEKAIAKAIDGGWNKIDSLTFSRAWPNERADHVKFNAFETGNADVGGVTFDLNTIIFNHDFAKALWGEGTELNYDGRTEEEFLKNELVAYSVTVHNVNTIDNWKYHLQQMVIAEDPIKYLGDNL